MVNMTEKLTERPPIKTNGNDNWLSIFLVLNDIKKTIFKQKVLCECTIFKSCGLSLSLHMNFECLKTAFNISAATKMNSWNNRILHLMAGKHPKGLLGIINYNKERYKLMYFGVN
jgi:hypothetical protein